MLFDFKLVFTQIPRLLAYLPVTLELTAAAMIIGWVFGLIIALVKQSKVPVLSQLSAVFVSIMRGTPIIVQLYLSYFGIPLALKYFNYYHGSSYNINSIPSMVFAIVALGLNQSAFDSETIRSAVNSVDKGQIEAAKSINMTNMQILLRILFPEALAVALPSLGNSLIALVKGTSLAFSCSIVEMTAEGKILAGTSYRYFESYCSLAIIYWGLTLVIERVFHALEKRFTVPESPAQPKESAK